MRFKIPSRFDFEPMTVAKAVSDVLSANGLNPLCEVNKTHIKVEESSLSPGVKTQIKNAIIPLMIDTTGDADITA